MIQPKCREAMRVTGKLNTTTYLSAMPTNAATPALLALNRSSCGNADKASANALPPGAPPPDASPPPSHASSSLPKNQNCGFKSLHFVMIS